MTDEPAMPAEDLDPQARSYYLAEFFSHGTSGARVGEGFTVDWDAIAALLPPLSAPSARPGDDELFFEVPDPFPASEMPISIDDHTDLEHVWTDL